ncbi:MAG: glycoside hydrolase family protein [Bacillota bacterium]|nr:glycoside hydrolase family protein [Bacillota bacterium]
MLKHTIQEQLILHEGLRLTPYKCPADKWTIGVGRNLEDVGLSKSEQMRLFGTSGLSRLEVIDGLLERKISKDEALYLLENDIRVCTADVNTFPWVKDLDPVRQKVLIDMRFNLGLAGLKGFRRMLAALEAKDYRWAAAEMKDSAWYRQVGTRGVRLVDMMRTGEDYHA